jgi:trimethylamine--corrinoid protein Co-methyltransferase
VARPQISLLSLTERDFIHERSLEVLAEVGVQFRSAKALDVLDQAGCKVDHDSEIVRFPVELVEWAVEQLPREVLLPGRNPQRDALLDGAKTFATVAGICPFVVDMNTGLYRAPRLGDLEDLTRLADALDAFGIVWYSVSPTDDAPANVVDLAATACMLAATGKHVMGQVTRPAEVPFALEIVRLCSETAGHDHAPPFSTIYCPISPLQHDGPAIEAAMALAAQGVPIDIFSLGLAGATAPVTLAGTMTQTNCEVLSAVVLLELVAPGCPLIYSANAGIMDMRTSRFAASTPETVLMNVALIELAHSYGMPALSVGFVPDTSEVGFRCGAEDMGFALPTLLARPDIMTGLGTLEAGQAVSFPKMVLDAEIFTYLSRLTEGIAVDDEHSSIETIADVGPGGHYLGEKETRRRVREGEHWLPDLFHRHSYHDRRNGAADELQRAKERVVQLLAEHRSPPLPAGARERVADVLASAERDLP